jgi:hypothetical protein
VTDSDIKRFYCKIDVPRNEGCWNWIAARYPDGYGQFYLYGKLNAAHRISHEYFTGEKIPTGMVMDHICRNRSCVRPDHLRVVTRRINAIENNSGVAAVNAAKTNCPQGHEYTKENTYIIKYKKTNWPSRYCKTCHDKSSRKFRLLHKERLNELNRKYRAQKRESI